MAAGRETTGRMPATESERMKYYFRCPECGSNEEFSTPNEESSGLGLTLLVFGGLLSALLYADATCRRVQCGKCAYIFRQPAMPRTAVSGLAAWIMGIIVLFVFATSLALAVPEILDSIPQSATLTAIEQLISDNPRAILLGLVSMMVMTVLIFVLSLLASWVSNYRAHAALRKKFETEPKQCATSKQEASTMN